MTRGSEVVKPLSGQQGEIKELAPWLATRDKSVGFRFLSGVTLKEEDAQGRGRTHCQPGMLRFEATVACTLAVTSAEGIAQLSQVVADGGQVLYKHPQTLCRLLGICHVVRNDFQSPERYFYELGAFIAKDSYAYRPGMSRPEGFK